MAAWHPLSRAGTIALLALVLAVSSGAEDDAMAKETVGFGELKVITVAPPRGRGARPQRLRDARSRSRCDAPRRARAHSLLATARRPFARGVAAHDVLRHTAPLLCSRHRMHSWPACSLPPLEPARRSRLPAGPSPLPASPAPQCLPGGVARRGGAPVVAAARVPVQGLPVGRRVRPPHGAGGTPGGRGPCVAGALQAAAPCLTGHDRQARARLGRATGHAQAPPLLMEQARQASTHHRLPSMGWAGKQAFGPVHLPDFPSILRRRPPLHPLLTHPSPSALLACRRRGRGSSRATLSTTRQASWSPARRAPARARSSTPRRTRSWRRWRSAWRRPPWRRGVSALGRRGGPPKHGTRAARALWVEGRSLSRGAGGSHGRSPVQVCDAGGQMAWRRGTRWQPPSARKVARSVADRVTPPTRRAAHLRPPGVDADPAVRQRAEVR